ncbi:hypothetical protein Psta_1646 [Pirellula staleyi DSM 6068]|uniref:DUF1772 domain-containing protein n=1 Tax=Pirellula staleyi (strain ATCC 27377 / DSM 6068 / ICPB 4128) TaxID=530564 RepID=D2QYA7_PIRSD|nr:hypothetical protein [Pirellula staleyi]ADB16321.1 hypothetical protein Psta_1646 [Pirellula staleyi DSM 6068]
MLMLDEILLIHVAATWGMVGLIGIVQLVHYPLMNYVPADRFPEFEQAHRSRITYIVAPLMLIESASAVLLVSLPTPAPITTLAWIGMVLLLGNWLSTLLLQMPCHFKLSQKFDTATHRFLVRSNWIRSILWFLRGLVALAMLWYSSANSSF